MKSMHRCTPIRWAGAALTAALLAGCSRAPTQSAPAQTTISATTVAARVGTIATARQLGGFIAPLQNVSISSSLTEPAARVNVLEGQHVAAGTVLAVFDTSDLNAELESDIHAAREAEANATKQYFTGAQTISTGSSNVANAESTLAQATEKARLDRINLARDASLLHQQYISQQTYDSQLSTVQTDDAAIRSDKAAVANTRLTALTNGSQSTGLQGATLASAREAAAQARASARQVQAQIARATIYAPVDGIVTNRNINPGEYPGSRTLFTIQAITTVYAQLNASSEELDGVQVGDRVAVNAHGTTAAQAGRVTAVLGQAAPGSTNFTIKAEIPNASGALLAGMAVVGTIALAPTRGTLVPRASLASNETQIGVVRGATYHVVPVRIIAQDDVNAIVTGVSPGTKVVTGAPDLRDGQRVVVR